MSKVWNDSTSFSYRVALARRYSDQLTRLGLCGRDDMNGLTGRFAFPLPARHARASGRGIEEHV